MREILQTREILGLPYFDGGKERALFLALECAVRRAPFAVFTPGATVAARAARENTFLSLLTRADLLLPDGFGCSLASRLSGKGRLPRVAGIDFAEALFSASETLSPRVFLYGGKAGVAARAAVHLREKYPWLILSYTDGYGDDPFRRIAAFSPHIVCVCLGAGKQEAWIDAHKSEVGGVLLGLGGSLDVWSGDVRRAPRILQRTGLEWAYRTLLEPRRIKRLFPLPRYFAKCLVSRRSSKCQKRQEKAYFDVEM